MLKYWGSHWTNTLGNSFWCIFIFVPFSHACAFGATPTTSSAASDPWTVPAFSARAPSPTTTTPIAAGERRATNQQQEEESHVTYPAAILPNYCTHIHTNTYLSGSKCLTTDVIPAEVDSELESRGTAGLIMSTSRPLKQTNFLYSHTHGGKRRKGWRRWSLSTGCTQSVAGLAIPVNGPVTGTDTQSYRQETTDHLLSEGMTGDVHGPSSGAPWKTEKLMWAPIHFPLLGPERLSLTLVTLPSNVVADEAVWRSGIPPQRSPGKRSFLIVIQRMTHS